MPHYLIRGCRGTGRGASHWDATYTTEKGFHAVAFTASSEDNRTKTCILEKAPITSFRYLGNQNRPKKSSLYLLKHILVPAIPNEVFVCSLAHTQSTRTLHKHARFPWAINLPKFTFSAITATLARILDIFAYVVFRGREPGIYYSWPDCDKQVKGFSGNYYLGYDTRCEAETAFADWEQSSSVYEAAKPRIQTDPFSDHDAKGLSLGENPPDTSLKYPQSKENHPRLIPLQADNTPKSLIRSIIDITSPDDEQGPAAKKLKSGADDFKSNIDFIGFDPDTLNEALEVEGPQHVELTSAQLVVVDLELNGCNLFLTGAAGSGKTITLKEIIRRLKDSKNLGVQVVAPTGIAALPLDGKTTYSFAGWKPDSLKEPMKTLLQGVKKTTTTAIRSLDVLIVEEISMVENQMLERLNRLLQHIMQSNLPFGGKQVIFVGDFHQLPPVKPFENCLECGSSMVDAGPLLHCTKSCIGSKGVHFREGDKWAFNAPVWAKLKLKHVRLDQIHRQKDTQFQNILNKVRNGDLLTDEEWNDLERNKNLPENVFAVRLMSRVSKVKSFNDKQLELLPSEEKTWAAYDTYTKYMKSLQYHRFPAELTLKVGAKVVLLSNLDPKHGLVNGTQGEVIQFVDTQKWQTKQQGLWEKACFDVFQPLNKFLWPIVRFANGRTQAIPPVTQSSLKGPDDRRYLISRTQIPLALAWALSIHKSQGMTLEYAEVSSRDIFESGQLYVGLSRVTTLGGLTVTGFSRKRTSMNPDVLNFYKNAKWGRLGPVNTLSGFGFAKFKTDREASADQLGSIDTKIAQEGKKPLLRLSPLPHIDSELPSPDDKEN
ncbi:uncharacterized protein BP5553_08958 [Venustampulla echinocandica]|uniref:ATP-dependent DNA helicase n=1 Tax=Venustampulla echinocandica TaxID=2656787 RepID=A0A370TDH1_9HELO|nr:uncharacterized protein BP5553_08958 [Venustampulla echinocandica]RDL32502.1 hypothetical protein BP5553_08958 [Venustampulla echinocandica]